MCPDPPPRKLSSHRFWKSKCASAPVRRRTAAIHRSAILVGSRARTRDFGFELSQADSFFSCFSVCPGRTEAPQLCAASVSASQGRPVLMRQAMYDSQSPHSARADRCVRRHRIGSPRLAFPFLWLRRDLHKSARRAEPRRAAAGSSSPAPKTQILIFLSSAKYLFNFSQPKI